MVRRMKFPAAQRMDSVPTAATTTTNNTAWRPAVPAHAWWLVMEMKNETLSESAKNDLYHRIAGSGGLDGLEYKSDKNDVVPLIFHYQGRTPGVIITAAHRNELIKLMDGIKQKFREFMLAAAKQLARDKAVTLKLITSEQSYADLRKTLFNMDVEFFTANQTALFSLQQVGREFIKKQCLIFLQDHVGGIRVEITDPSAGWNKGGNEVVSLQRPHLNWSGHSLWIMARDITKEVSRSLQRASHNGKSKSKLLARRQNGALSTTKDESDNNTVTNEPNAKRSKRDSSGTVIIMPRHQEENDNDDMNNMMPPIAPQAPPPPLPPPPQPHVPPNQYPMIGRRPYQEAQMTAGSSTRTTNNNVWRPAVPAHAMITTTNNNVWRPAVPAHAWWLVTEMKNETLSESAKNDLYHKIAGNGGLDGLEYKSNANDVVPLVFYYQGRTPGIVITAAHRSELIKLMDGIKEKCRKFIIVATKQLARDKAVMHKLITSSQSFADLRNTLSNMDLENFTANKTAIFSLQQVSREFIKKQCSIFFQGRGIRVEITDPYAGWKKNQEHGRYEVVSLHNPSPDWSGHSLWIMARDSAKEVARSLQKASQNGKSKCKVLTRRRKSALLTTNDESDGNNETNEPNAKRSKRESSGSVIVMPRHREEDDNHDINTWPPLAAPAPPPSLPPPPPQPRVPPKQYSITTALTELKKWNWHSEIDKEKVFSLLGISDDAV